jgi:hypothetical protein
VSEKERQSLACEHGIPFFETSALLDDDSVGRIFDSLVRAMQTTKTYDHSSLQGLPLSRE